MTQNKIVRGVATKVVTDEFGWISVYYHGHCVVYIRRNSFTLNSCRHKTYTTKLRMNQAMNQFALGWTVYQKNFDWFVQCNSTGEVRPFEDGMQLPIRRAVC